MVVIQEGQSFNIRPKSFKKALKWALKGYKMAQKGPKSYLRGVISYQNKPKKAKKEPIWGPKGGVFGRAGRGPRGGSEGGGTPPGGGVPGGVRGVKNGPPKGGPLVEHFLAPFHRGFLRSVWAG